MIETHEKVVLFFAGQLESDSFAGKAEKKGWYGKDMVSRFFKALEKKGRPILRKQAGRAFADLFLSEMNARYEWGSIRDALAFVPKVYSHLVRGDGAGVWIYDELSEGFCMLRENTRFDCFFTEGFLQALLQGLGARGAVVKHNECRKDTPNSKFCYYELIWMRSNL